jgi:putative tryptophan/tyrosine transport system substrate-binding protein
VRVKVDIILVSGDRGIRAAKNATETIPIVMTGQGLDPIKVGHVESLARPGGNVTESTNIDPDLSAKRLDVPSQTARRACSEEPTSHNVRAAYSVRGRWPYLVWA